MDDYQTYLLEMLVYRLSPGNKEFDDWRKAVKETYGATAKTEVPKETNQPQPPAAGGGAVEGVRNTYGEKIRAVLKKQNDEG